MNKPRILTAGIATLLALPLTAAAVERNWIANPGDGIWSNVANWDANGVPITGAGDRIFVHTPGSVTGVAINADVLFMAVGTAGAPASGYTFGAGTYNLGTIYIGEGHVGNGYVSAGPFNNNFGRAFINAGTTINVNTFHLGEWDGASGHVSQSGGDLNIAGQFRLGHATGLGLGAVSVSASVLNLAGKGAAATNSAVGAISLAGGQVTFGLNGAASDRLSSSGVITLAGANIVHLVSVGGVVIGNTYTLLSGTGFAGAGTLALGSVPGGFYTWTPNQTATTYEVTPTGAATPGAAYWFGGASPVWSDASFAPVSNWRTTADGTTDTNQLPGPTTDVFFAAAGASHLTTNTLGVDTFIKSLTMPSATTGAVAIGGGNVLNITNGIARQTGAGSLTINTGSVAVNGAQTRSNNDSGNLLTVNAPLSGSDLTTGGGGVIVLGGNNAGYTATLTVGNGTVRLAHANAAGSTAANIVVNGTLDLNGNSLTKADLGGSGIIGTGIAGAVSVTAGSGTFGGVIQNGSGTLSLVKNGGGNLFLTGANSYSGGTTINAGNLVIGNGGTTGALGTGTTILSSTLVVKEGAGRMVLNAPNAAGGIFTVNAGTLALVGDQQANRLPANAIVQINSGGTLELTSTNVASFSANYIVGAGGTLTNGAGADHAHIGAVLLSGGTWTTDAASASYDSENYYLHGSVTVGGSVPSLITRQGGTAADRGISWNGPITFDVANVTGSAATDLTVSTELENADSGAAAQLVKAGAGTMTLTFANSYSGGTTISAGTLQVGDGGTTGTLGGGAVADDASLVFKRSDALTVTAAISGAGAVTNAGGVLNLNGAQGYGTLNATSGTTNVNGSFTAGTATVNASAPVNFYASQTLAALNIADGVEVTFGDGQSLTGGPEKPPVFGGVTVVPEPGSLASLSLGLGLLLVRRRPAR